MDVEEILASPTYSHSNLLDAKVKGRRTPSIIFNGKRQCRLGEWYSRYTWICGSSTLKALFCFPCLLFQKEKSNWSGVGIKDVKNLSNLVKKHLKSQCHISAKITFSMLGKVRIDEALDEAARIGRVKHNEEVIRNREFVRHHVKAAIFLCSQSLAFRGRQEDVLSHNRGNFVELLSFACDFSRNSDLEKALCGTPTTPTFTGLSSGIQNDIIHCLYTLVLEEIQRRVHKAPYLSLMADETTDISNVSQLTIAVRIVHEGQIYEHFIDTVDVSRTHTAAVTAQEIVDSLKSKIAYVPTDATPVMIGQSYDGASTMSGIHKGVHAIIQKMWPSAKYVHCYAHKWALVIKKACDSIDDVVIFFGILQNVTTFFRASPKRASRLSGALPGTTDTRWLSRGKSVKSIAAKYDEIMEVLSAIQTDREFDASARVQAIGLHQQLRQFKNVFLLNVFKKVFKLSDVITQKLQSTHIDPAVVASKVSDYKQNLQNMRCDAEFKNMVALTKEKNPVISHQRKRKSNVLVHRDSGYNPAQIDEICAEEKAKGLMYEIIDCLVSQLDTRFHDIGNLDWVRLIDPKNFEVFKNDAFTVLELIALLRQQHPAIVDNKDAFTSELQVLYTDSQLRGALQSRAVRREDGQEDIDMFVLLKCLHDLDLADDIPNVYRALVAALTLTLTSVVCERNFSVLRRIKNYMRSSMGQERLLHLMLLSIENKLLSEMASTSDFIDTVIDRFAGMKERRIKLLFRK